MDAECAFKFSYFRMSRNLLTSGLKTLTFHLLSNPAILSKLRAELKQALPDANASPSIKDMEQLPYLGAVISEGLRISMGLSKRQTRISPDEKMLFHDGNKQWYIPAGVSASAISSVL